MITILLLSAGVISISPGSTHPFMDCIFDILNLSALLFITETVFYNLANRFFSN